jgi:hypothetical protein
MPPTHRYHAEAQALEGRIDLPFSSPIEPQAHAKIPDTGGYFSQRTDSFRVEGIVSYNAAHTQVSGHQEHKHGNPFITLSTSAIEDLNILNVITADRVVAQVATEHPVEGYVPKVTFLGTTFHNLRIGGFAVEVELDLDMPTDHPRGVAYTRHDGFMARVRERLGPVRQYGDGLPEEIATRYALDVSNLKGGGEKTEFSIVKRVEGRFPGRAFGNALEIFNFGKVFLGNVTIEHRDPANGRDIHKETLIKLNMFEVRMGCIATGHVTGGSTTNNGTTDPG